MQERELPEGSAQRPDLVVDAERNRQRFEQMTAAFTLGELDRLNEDGSVTKIVSYERHIDPLDHKELALITEFRLRAAASGYREAFSPLVLPTQSSFVPGQSEAMRSPDHPLRALTFVQFGYEKPAGIKRAGAEFPRRP
jgi:hypothetical protein